MIIGYWQVTGSRTSFKRVERGSHSRGSSACQFPPLYAQTARNRPLVLPELSVVLSRGEYSNGPEVCTLKPLARVKVEY